MFTELAVIDWIALVFAAVLLAAAIAAAVLAYMTSSHGQLPALSTLRNKGGRTGDVVEAEPIEPTNTSTRQPSAVLTPPPIPEHAKRIPAHALLKSSTQPAVGDRSGAGVEDAQASVTQGASDIDRRLAERAARLSGRPVPEPASLVHSPRVHQVAESSAPAHAATLTVAAQSGGVSGAADHFDSTEGFSARNPGFFEDPLGRHELRYWDGHAWTEYVKERGERFTDPL